MSLRSNFYLDLVDEHESWLKSHSRKKQTEFKRLLNQDRESAIAEAYLRRFLCRNEVQVAPNELINEFGKSPDFICSKLDNQFLIEVTSISIETATSHTQIPNEPVPGAHGYQLLLQAIFTSCKKKAKQCAGFDIPVMLAIVTFHGFAYMVTAAPGRFDMLLTGEQLIGFEAGKSSNITYLWDAAFVKPSQDPDSLFPMPARSSLSGILFCGGHLDELKVVCALHPFSGNRFSKEILPFIPYCELEIDPSGERFKTTWTNAPD